MRSKDLNDLKKNKGIIYLTKREKDDDNLLAGIVEILADGLIHQVPLPETAQVDALHIAIATVHGIEYLLTWNCTHIANTILCPQIETICRLFKGIIYLTKRGYVIIFLP